MSFFHSKQACHIEPWIHWHRRNKRTMELDGNFICNWKNKVCFSLKAYMSEQIQCSVKLALTCVSWMWPSLPWCSAKSVKVLVFWFSAKYSQSLTFSVIDHKWFFLILSVEKLHFFAQPEQFIEHILIWMVGVSFLGHLRSTVCNALCV